MIDTNIISQLREAILSYKDTILYYTNLSREEQEQYLLSKYNRTNLLKLDKELSNEIKEQTIFDEYSIHTKKISIEEEKQFSIEYYNLQKRIQKKEVFTGHHLAILTAQLYYETHLIDKKYKIYFEIIHNTWYYIGNGNFYELNKITINKIFTKSIDLYLLTGAKHPYLSEANNKIISAVKYFNLTIDDYVISEGCIKINDTAEKKIHNQIETLISEVGGLTILRLLFNNDLYNKYNKVLDRFIICKNKKLTLQNYKTPIPYNYLIKICLKHLNIRIVNHLNNDILEKYKQIIEKSQYLVDILGIYSTNPLSETNINPLSLIDFISDNALFENLYSPAQYSKDFLDIVLKKVFYPALIKHSKCPNLYKTKSFKAFILLIFKEFDLKIITSKYISDKLRISQSISKKLLDYFSISVLESNSEYNEILGKTTSSHWPLVKLNDSEYFLLSSNFSGYSFCNRIQDELQSKEFNHEIGLNIEIFVKELLKQKHFSFKYGHYSPKIPKEEGECDLILEDDKRILFIELKNCGLPYEFENVDIVTILKTLGQGMLKAQTQILHHKLHLIKNDFTMKLYKDIKETTPAFVLNNTKNKRIYSISICISEYAFFTSGTIAKCLTENLANMTFNTYDKTRDKELDQLNKLSTKMRDLIEIYSQHKENLTNNDLFFCSSFKSLQQFYTALKLCTSIEEFIDYLTFDTYMILPFFDYYANLLAKINFNKTKK